MKYKLDLRSNMRSSEGPESLNWTDIGFLVTGLPAGLDVRIGPKQGGGWSVLRIVDDEIGEWEGDYESPLAALDAMQQYVDEDFSR
jgi:hypothetical protein